MHRTFLHVTLSVRVLHGQQVADDWRWSNYRSRWGQNLCHTSGEKLILLHAISIPSPSQSFFPIDIKTFLISVLHRRKRERESCCLCSGPKLIANVKMDPSCSWSFAQAIWPTICGVCSQPHQTHVCGILELFGAFMNTQLHNLIELFYIKNYIKKDIIEYIFKIKLRSIIQFFLKYIYSNVHSSLWPQDIYITLIFLIEKYYFNCNILYK